MNHLLRATVFAFVLLFSMAQKGNEGARLFVGAETRAHAETWEPLFNGKDLSGWAPKIAGHPLGDNFGNTFRVADGVLSVRYDAYGENFDNRFGALFYTEKLSDYRLRAEYRFVGETAPGGPSWGFRDSGIQYHCQPPESMGLNQPFPVSLEYNLHGGNGTDERPVGAVCANGMFIEIDGGRNTAYCTPPAASRTFHGDQWVTLEIDVKDGVITHYVNGEEILKFSNPTFNPDHEIAKTLFSDGNLSVTGGYISLQSNSHPIDFRKIELLRY